jgi:hypothetical protein
LRYTFGITTKGWKRLNRTKRREIKLNALRAEIQRLRDVAFDAKMQAKDAEAGAAQTVMLAESLIAAVLEACGKSEITVCPTPDQRLEIVLGENGYILKLATESDKVSEEAEVE